MYFIDSDNELEDYLGEEYLDMFGEFYDLDDSDLLHSEDDYDEASYKSYPSEEEINHMKRCKDYFFKLNEQRKAEQFCDATIVVQGRQFPVHRSILTAASSYFSAMFTGSFTEKDKQKIDIQCVSADIFSVLLDFMYGAAIKLSFENVKEIYMAGDMLCIDALISECQHFIKDNWVMSSDIQTVYEMATQFEMSDVIENIIHNARINLIGFMNSDFRELHHTFLCNVLDGRTTIWQLKNECTMAEHILRWAMHHPEERLPEHAPKVFSMIRFEFILHEEFTKLLESINSQENANTDLVRTFRECLETMYQNSHQRLIDYSVDLVLPVETTINSFDFKLWKWETLSCTLPKVAESYVLSDGDLHAFYVEGCIKVNLQSKKTIRLPNFPSRRKESVYTVVNKVIYATGGIDETTSKPLGEILSLKPNSQQWHHGITWLKNKCNASSIVFKQCIYFVGGKGCHEKPNSNSECFLYNSVTRYFRKVCTLSFPVSQPYLAIHNNILYVFSNQTNSFPRVCFERIDLQRHKLLPPCEPKGLEFYHPILGVCSVDEGIIIVNTFDQKILLTLFRPTEEPYMENLGIIIKPGSCTDEHGFSRSFPKLRMLFHASK